MIKNKLIITKTPLRLSFFGGGSDIGQFYTKHKGSVISSSINKYVYVTVKNHGSLFDEKYRINYQISENTNKKNSIKNNIIRECLNFLKIDEPLYISTVADLPAKSGLGSSSSFTVGLLNALYSFKGIKVSSGKLAEEASHVEIKLIKSPIGKQDQYAAAIGGFNKFDFSKEGVKTENLENIINPNKFFNHLLLFWTGIDRSTNNILNSIDYKNESTIRNLVSIVENCNTAYGLIKKDSKDNILKISKLLNISWKSKKALSKKISNKKIDEAYKLSIKNGAWGGKIAGAGGGGFLMLMTLPKYKKRIIKSLKSFKHLPVNFEPHGSALITNDL